MGSTSPAYIRVLVRVRPFNDKELKSCGNSGSSNILAIDSSSGGNIEFNSNEESESTAGGNITIKKPASDDAPSRRRISAFSENGRQSEVGDSNNPLTAKKFSFDAVHGIRSTQNDIFESVKGIVDAVVGGYNGTIVAYGQTGSGKTHTVFGSQEGGEGLVQRSLRALFNKFTLSQAKAVSDESSICAEEGDVYQENGTVETIFKASFFEIFNERVYDLLSTECLDSNLPVREDTSGVYVEGLKEIQVNNTDEAEQILNEGMSNRHVAATNMNRTSSRSHAVFALSVKSVHTSNDGLRKVRNSKFTLVDLAGSERQKSTDAVGDRLKEAASINKSLLCLGHVINTLVDMESGRKRHIPFRDSKLTFLLRDSWGGNSKTCLVATVSPSAISLSETISTLNFAQRAKLIKNNAILNEDTCGTIAGLQAEVERLRSQLSERSANTSPSNSLSLQANYQSEHPLQFQVDDGIVSVAKRRADRAEEKVVQLEKHVSDEKEIVNTLKRKLQESAMVGKFKERRIGYLQRKNGVLDDNGHVSILNKEIESLKRQVELPSAEAIEWRAAYEEVKENLDKQMDTNDNIPEDEFAKLDEVIKHLDSEKDASEGQVKELKQSKLMKQKEVDTLLEVVDHLEKQETSLQEQLNNKEQKMNDTNDRLIAAKSEIEYSNDQITKVKDQLLGNEKNLAIQTAKTVDFSREIDNVKCLLEQKSASLTALDCCKTKIEEKLESSINELKAMEIKQNSEIAEFRTSESELNFRLEDTLKENILLNQKFEITTTALEIQKNSVIILEKKIKDSSSANDSIFEHLKGEKESLNEKLQKQITDFEIEIEALSKEKQKLEHELKDSTNNLKEYTHSMEKMDEELNKMKADKYRAVQVMELKISELETSQKELLKEISLFESGMDEEKKRYVVLTEENEMLEERTKLKIESMQSENETMHHKANIKFEVQGESHKNEVSILNEKYTLLSNNKVRLEALLKEDREDASELQVTLENVTAQLLNAQTNLSSAQINVQKLKFLEDENKRLRIEICSCEIKFQTGKVQAVESAKALQEQFSVVNTLEEQLHLKHEKEQDSFLLDKQVKELETNVNVLTTLNTELECNIQELNIQINKDLKKFECQNSSKIELEEKIFCLEQQIKDNILCVQNDKHKLESNHELAIDGLKSDIQRLNAEKEDVLSTLSKCQKDNEQSSNEELMKLKEQLVLITNEKDEFLKESDTKLQRIGNEKENLVMEKKQVESMIIELKSTNTKTLDSLRTEKELAEKIQEDYGLLKHQQSLETSQLQSEIKFLEIDLCVYKKQCEKSLAAEEEAKRYVQQAEDRIILSKRGKKSLEVEIETLRETEKSFIEEIQILTKKNESLQNGNDELRKSFVQTERRRVREGNMMLDIEDDLASSQTIVNGALFAEQGATKQYDDLSEKMDSMLDRISPVTAETSHDCSFDESMFLPNIDYNTENKENVISSPMKNIRTPLKPINGGNYLPSGRKSAKKSLRKSSKKSWKLFSQTKIKNHIS